MTKRHKTSINYLKLPIFTGTQSGLVDKSNTQIVEYEENGVKSVIEIKNGKLSNYHRKLFVCLEYLYLKQNPDFQRKFLRTTFKEITDTLNTKSKNYQQLLKGLEELQDVNIKSVVKKKTGNNVETEEGMKFNILSGIRWKTNIDTKKEGTRRYTGYVDITFQDFHIQNLRSNYYRLINFELVRRLSNNTIRLFDYLNLNSYYLKDDVYRQRKKVKFQYEKLVSFLLLKEQSKNSYKERQFEKQLQELQEKGVIKSYEWEHDFFNSWLNITLSQSINLWGTYNPKKLDDVKKLTPLENKLKEYGVPPKQREFLLNGYSEEYITSKLEQYEYITKNIPQKIKGRGSYIYNSIKDDWTDDSFIEYKEQQKQKELNLFSKKKKEEIEKNHNEYVKYINEMCLEYITKMTEEEKKEIDIQVYERVKKYKFLNTKSSISFYKEIERLKIVESKLEIPSYELWVKTFKG